ncbi:annexin a4 [Moesziomyces antarcticus]|uniref:Annexin n=2 Tax=Pseudozyma antarctica TaxID=84753 RepID=A0A081CFM3_PSEA2|nr:annexin a4 [Moesziomyces antarcticus]GAK65469.1 annexin a4 [Moesziomyces antarcticus]SPO46477.1 related to annexin XIV [Moesziomyces antarcticus]
MSWQQNQYPPPQGYGAPPPMPQGGGYGAYPPPGGPPPPHAGGYGAPPAPYAGGYGAPPGPPPPQHGYPQQHHGHHGHHAHPPPPQPGYGYGAPAHAPPPPAAAGAFYLGVPIPPPPPHQPAPPPPGYNAAQDVERIRKATKGFGTDEGSLIATLAPLDAFQIDALRHTFKATVGKDLLQVLEKETSGWFEAALRAKVLGPVLYDCWLIKRACQGAGTHEDLLNEVILGRSNSEIHILKQAYRATYGKDLERVVEDELSFKTKRMFTMAMQGVRQEDNVPINPQAVDADAAALHNAAKGAGTDEIAICGILIQRSTPHLAAVAQAYHRLYRKHLSSMIDSEFSGHMRDALRYIVDGVENDGQGVTRDARLLEDSMKGMGTKDERLVYRVARLHWNKHRFEGQIKPAYAQLFHKKGLKNRVEGETSGDYKRMLSAMIGS